MKNQNHVNYQYVKISYSDNIAIVTFNRPKRRNALDYNFLEEIEHCCLGFREKPDVYAVIFTGEGKHFSAGADLNEMNNYPDMPLVQKRRRWRIGERTIQAVRQIDQLTFAAWNGGAIGGGACLVTAMDFRVGNSQCFIQYPEIDIGLNLMWQSLPLTTRLFGSTTAKRLLIGGDRIDSQELLSCGVLETVTNDDNLIRETENMAQKYAEKSPIAAQMIKRSINNSDDALDRAFMHMDADQSLLTLTTEDQKIAVDAYLAKNKARFKGN